VLGARDEHARIDDELAREEFLAAAKMLQRLATAAAEKQLVEPEPFAVIDLVPTLGDEASTIPTEDVGEQHLGLEARALDAVLVEITRGALELDGHRPAHAGAPSLRASAWLEVTSASTTGSSSPSR